MSTGMWRSMSAHRYARASLAPVSRLKVWSVLSSALYWSACFFWVSCTRNKHLDTAPCQTVVNDLVMAVPAKPCACPQHPFSSTAKPLRRSDAAMLEFKTKASLERCKNVTLHTHLKGPYHDNWLSLEGAEPQLDQGLNFCLSSDLQVCDCIVISHHKYFACEMRWKIISMHNHANVLGGQPQTD